MKISLSPDNPNYCARLIKLPAPRKHTNADKLQCLSVLGNNIVTGLTAKEGDLYVYFPLECSINIKYLAHSDSLDQPDLNRNKTKGFFSPKHGRVKAISLRGEKSEGYVVPATTIEEWSGYKFSDSDLDKDFDTIGDVVLCKKYVNSNALRKLANAENANKKKRGQVKRVSKLIDNQYRLHVDTKQLKKEIDKVFPNDMIAISYKLHGASGIASKILTKKKLTPYQKFMKFLGADINLSVYDYVWGSRRVIKNEYEDNDKQKIHYYDTDIWSIAAERLKPALQDGMTFYFEIVGQTPTGKWIQKNYDYGTEAGKMELYIYRITSTNYSGEVIELSTPQMIAYCNKHGLKTPHQFYYGKAKDLFPEISTENHWHENLLKKLQEVYNEKKCFMCKQDVPEEGIILRVEREYFDAFKLKSFAFLKRETEELDSGEVNIEDVESVKPEETQPAST